MGMSEEGPGGGQRCPPLTRSCFRGVHLSSPSQVITSSPSQTSRSSYCFLLVQEIEKKKMSLLSHVTQDLGRTEKTNFGTLKQ